MATNHFVAGPRRQRGGSDGAQRLVVAADAVSATRTDNDRRRSASHRADLRSLPASPDLFGSQFGSQKQKRRRMSYIAATTGPHPATPDCMSRRCPRRGTSRRTNCSQAVQSYAELNFEKASLAALLRPGRESNARPTA